MHRRILVTWFLSWAIGHGRCGTAGHPDPLLYIHGGLGIGTVDTRSQPRG